MERAGLSLKEMQPHQQQLAYALLHSALCHRGYSKALNIKALEQILHELENQSPIRDPSRYHFFIFGQPSTEQTWGWRVEGHHLSVSLTLVEGQKIVGTPSFFGANPARVLQGPQEGLRVLGAEEDLARQLVQSLDEAQRQTAIVQTEAPSDIILGPGRASLLASTAPSFTTALAWPILHQEPGPLALLGMLLTFSGTAFVFTAPSKRRSGHAEGGIAMGIASGLLGALGQAGGYVLSKVALRTGLDPLSATVIRVACATVGSRVE